MTPEERHKRRILLAIKANATRNETRVYKPEKKRRRNALRRHRFDTYNVGEVAHATNPTLPL